MSMRIDWLGYKGFRELRTSPAAHELVKVEAEKVLGRCQTGGKSVYAVSSTPGRNRAHANVYTDNPAAMVDNAKRNTLVKALFGGG